MEERKFFQQDIVFVYEKEGDGKPIRCFPIDAKEKLATGKYTVTNPTTAAPEEAKAETVDNAEHEILTPDSGPAMKLKEMKINSLRAIARKAEIPGYGKMTKADLVQALLDADLG